MNEIGCFIIDVSDNAYRRDSKLIFDYMKKQILLYHNN